MTNLKEPYDELYACRPRLSVNCETAGWSGSADSLSPGQGREGPGQDLSEEVRSIVGIKPLLRACPLHISTASTGPDCMPPPAPAVSYGHSRCPGRKAGPCRRYRTDARSSVRSSHPAAAASACLALPGCAASSHTPLPFRPACHPSCAFRDPVPRCKSALPVRSIQRQLHCCDIPCPPLLPRLHRDALDICLPAVRP